MNETGLIWETVRIVGNNWNLEESMKSLVSYQVDLQDRGWSNIVVQIFDVPSWRNCKHSNFTTKWTRRWSFLQPEPEHNVYRLQSGRRQKAKLELFWTFILFYLREHCYYYQSPPLPCPSHFFLRILASFRYKLSPGWKFQACSMLPRTSCDGFCGMCRLQAQNGFPFKTMAELMLCNVKARIHFSRFSSYHEFVAAVVVTPFRVTNHWIRSEGSFLIWNMPEYQRLISG